MKSIDENAPDDVLRVLVGNKSDLHHRIVISTQEGKKLAENYRVDYFETSAKSDTNTNVTQMFNYIVEKLLDRRQPKPLQSGIDMNLPNNPPNGLQERLTNCC